MNIGIFEVCLSGIIVSSIGSIISIIVISIRVISVGGTSQIFSGFLVSGTILKH